MNESTLRILLNMFRTKSRQILVCDIVTVTGYTFKEVVAALNELVKYKEIKVVKVDTLYAF
jgi:orotate phosphoribosyltransferase-like protein